MNVAFAMLADAATVDPRGKVNILGGGIDSISAPQFPVTHPQLIFICRLQLSPVECDLDHPLRIDLIDPDGQQLAQVAGGVRGQRLVDDPHRPVNADLLLGFGGLTFPAPGDYAFHVLVNQMEIAVVPLFVRPQAPVQ